MLIRVKREVGSIGDTCEYCGKHIKPGKTAVYTYEVVNKTAQYDVNDYTSVTCSVACSKELIN